jgi:glycosyltransferase involved in cell wall biosynthesis
MRYTRRGSLRALSRRIARARFVITISDFNQAYLRSIAPQSASKIRRLYNGIDLERFVPNGTATSGPFILLAVCRLVEKKGLGVLIEACRQLRDRQVAFQGWIVGAGRLQGQLAAQITAHRLDPYVQLLGPHTHREVLARYHAAHLFVLPCVVASDGDRDGLPAAIVEALACGLPVVTTPVTGIPEVVRHGHNGLLVQQGDGGALANAIEAVILDPALYERMRVNARTSVESIFDRRQTTAELARWFRTSMAEDVAER